jgi:SAM-dependent methyltransferase
VTLREAWEENAAAWAAWARRPGHDHFFWRFNLPAFLPLVPPAGRATLDVGCGEGRLGALLRERGHHVVGVEASPTLAALARELHEVVEADAASVPLPDASFDLAVAFMSLQDMDDMAGAVAEVGRLVERGGAFCLAVMHPLRDAGDFDGDDEDSPFVIPRSYFGGERYEQRVEREGMRMTFHSVQHSLEDYMGALESSGFVVEALREPVPPDELVHNFPRMVRQRRIPNYLHLRARKP